MRLVLLGALFLYSGLAVAAEGAPEPDPIEATIAEVIEDLIVPGQYDERGFTWYAMGVRPRAVNWHPSEPSDDTGEQTAFRRTGWLATAGRRARICLCGPAERVVVIAFNDNGGFGRSATTEESGLPALLRARGVTITPLQRDGDVADYEIHPTGQLPALLRIRGSCTSPMSRAAQRCWTDYTILLEADAESVSGAETCGGRGSYRG